MSAYKSDFLQVLAERGFIHQISEPEALDARARSGAIAAYIGFDCTAPSLHVGSLDLDRERALQMPVVQKNEWQDGS